jgi:hypothetical protein
MTRRPLNLLTALSLLLCVAVVALWARSSFVPATWVVSSGADRAVLVRSAGGALHVGRQSVERVGTGPGAGVRFDLTEPGSVGYDAPDSVGSFANGWYAPGAGLWSAGSTNVTIPPAVYLLRWNRMRVPYWLLVLLTVAAPATRGAVYSWQYSRAARRRRDRLCTRCGYDLTGNVSGVCPECGAVAKAPG